MESLRELLENHRITIPLLYSNNRNNCLRWEANTIVRNEELFSNFFQNAHLCTINDFEEYYGYSLMFLTPFICSALMMLRKQKDNLLW